MNEQIIKHFNNFQIADLDDDLVGMCKALVDWMVEIRKQVDPSKLPAPEKPEKFHKLEPHQPRMELRVNFRNFLGFAVKNQQEESEENKLINLYVVLQAGMYIYHMPIEKMIELGSQGVEITREVAKEVLLNDKMSPNWLKEPSGKDFTAIMI